MATPRPPSSPAKSPGGGRSGRLHEPRPPTAASDDTWEAARQAERQLPVSSKKVVGCSERLYSPARPQATKPTPTAPTELPAVGSLNYRFYYAHVKRWEDQRRTRQRAKDEQTAAARRRREAPPDEQSEEFVKRLYYDIVDERKGKRESQLQRCIRESRTRDRKLTPEEMRACNEKFYTQGVQKEIDLMKNLSHAHCAPIVSPRRRTDRQWEKMLVRLMN